MGNCHKKRSILKISIAIIFIIVLLYLAFGLNIYDREKLTYIFKLLSVNKNFGLYFFIATTVLVIFFIPISWFSALAAFFFGLKGFIYVIASGMIGAVVSFYLAKIFQTDLLNLISKVYYRKQRDISLDSIAKNIEKHGIGYVFFLRSMPFIPFSIANFISGITSISLGDYLLGTFLGLAPGQFATTYFFAKAVSIRTNPLGALIGALIKLGYVAVAFLLYKKSKYIAKD